MKHLLIVLLISGCARPHAESDDAEYQRRIDNVRSSVATLKSKREAEEERTRLRDETLAEEIAKERNEYLRTHPLPLEFKLALDADSLCIGMPGQLVRYILRRKHIDVNRTVTAAGSHEQWVVENSQYKYLYFQNGILTSWQE